MFTLTILLPAERGLSTFEIGTLLAIQSFIVLGLELPSGALSDTIGRRPLSSQAELSQSFPGPSPQAGTALCVTIAFGALVGGLLVAWNPFPKQ